ALVFHRIFVHWSKTLHHMNLVTVKVGSYIKPSPRDLVSNVHDQSVPFPVATGIAHKKVDLRINMRTAIEWNYAESVHLLPNEHHKSGRLHDLVPKLGVTQVREPGRITVRIGFLD